MLYEHKHECVNITQCVRTNDVSTMEIPIPRTMVPMLMNKGAKVYIKILPENAQYYFVKVNVEELCKIAQ